MTDQREATVIPRSTPKPSLEDFALVRNNSVGVGSTAWQIKGTGEFDLAQGRVNSSRLTGHGPQVRLLATRA
jgi:hypothetical protein